MYVLMPQIFQSLCSIKSTLKLRMEAYQNALKNAGSEVPDISALEQCKLDAEASYSQLCNEIMKMEEEGIKSYNAYNKPLTSDIYYGVAKSTKNKLTVNLSLRLGDMYLVAAVEDLAKRFNFDELLNLKEFIMRTQKCLHRNIGELYLQYNE